MLIILILYASIIFKVAALVSALLLIKLTRKRFLWIMASLAIVLMIVIRVIVFRATVVSESGSTLGLLHELVDLAFSFLLVVGVWGIAHYVRLADIYDERVRDTEKKLRALLELFGQAAIETDLSGTCTWCNRRCVELLGYKYENEVIGKSVRKIIRVIGSNGQDHGLEKQDIIEMGRAGIAVSDAVLLKADHSGFRAEYRAMACFANKQLAGTMIVFSDISERSQVGVELRECRVEVEKFLERKSRELDRSTRKYKALFEDSTDAIMLLNRERFFDCNPATLRMFGYATQDEFLGKHPGEVSPKYQPDGVDSVTAANKRIEEAYARGNNQFEWVHRTKGGRDFYADVKLSLLPLEGETLIQATVRDISVQKDAENKLHAIIDELKRARSEISRGENLATMGELSANMAHYINNPLAAILNCVQLINMERSAKGSIDREGLADLMNTIEVSALRCKNVIRSVLVFTRISKIMPGRFSLNSLITMTLAMLSAEKELEGIEIRTELEPDPGFVKVDEVLVEQAIATLLGRAKDAIRKKWTGAGGVITIKAWQSPQKGMAILSVSDNGEAIGESRRGAIFEPNAGADKADMEDSFGLSLSYEVIKIQGGDIRLESSGENGSVFTVSLPLA